MKILKKVLCLLLSGMFLLFAGACNSKTYEDTISNEFIDFKVNVNKTACFGEEKSVEIDYEITVKKEFWLYSGITFEPKDLIYVVCLNDKYDQAYYTENLKTENLLYSSAFEKNGNAVLSQLKCEVGDIFGDISYHQRLKSTGDVVERGKYRVYLCISSLYLEQPLVNGVLNGNGQEFLIPTDIVLNMQ